MQSQTTGVNNKNNFSSKMPDSQHYQKSQAAMPVSRLRHFDLNFI